MWFLIRSAFWLGLVFMHMNWSTDAPDRRALADAAAKGLSNLCASNPDACLRAAGRASQLLPVNSTR